MEKNDITFQKEWANLIEKLEKHFGEDLDVDGILFLIGIQELGKGPVKLTKSQKMDLMHVAVCSVLSKFNFYKFIGRDEDGWPHFEALEPLPHLKPMQQHRFMKEAILAYFEGATWE